MEVLLGENANELSPTNIVRLKGDWKRECKEIICLPRWLTRKQAVMGKGVLKKLKARSLNIAFRLAISNGALGLWIALEEEFPNTRQQRY